MKMKYLPALVLLLGTTGIFWWFLHFTKQTADILIFNARVYTVDRTNTIAEAVAIRGNRIIAVGTTERLTNRYHALQKIDADGKSVYPGFIDSHAHMVGLGASLFELNLASVESPEQAAALVTQKAATLPAGQWIRGRGWDQNDWKNRVYPSAVMLDKAAPNNPVVLSRIDGHAIWANSYAMKISGISDVPAPTIEGGQVIRDGQGRPTGIFIDNAIPLITRNVPPYTHAELVHALRLAAEECVRCGLTGVHDMGIDENILAAYEEIISSENLPLRIYAAIDGAGDLWNNFLQRGPDLGDPAGHLTVRALKLYVDGALGSRGAALIEPYSDDPETRGLTVTSAETLTAAATSALKNGFQVCIHAIGDRGNNIALTVYERALKNASMSGEQARLRIEHAQVLDPADLHRFKKLGIIPSMQPTHCTSDMYWAQARLGPKRITGAYAWRSLLDDGNIIPAGSDFPVESPNPLYGFYAAITRKDHQGIPRNAQDALAIFQISSDGIVDSSRFHDGWFPAQKMTREEALRAFTLWGAYAGFAEHQKGSVEPGKLADLVMISRDVMTVSPEQILNAKILMTLIGGKIVYRNTEVQKPLAFQ